MKKRLGYMMPFLAFGFMFGGTFSAHGQSQLGSPSNLSQPDKVGFESLGNPVAVGPSQLEFNKKLGYLKAKLTEALTLKDEKIITDVKGELKVALNEHFANDLAIREAKLAGLTKRADNAESQNKQRLAAKEELIELQLQSFVMEKDTIGSSERDKEFQNLFGIGRQSTPDATPGFATSDGPFFGDPNSAAAPSVQQNRTSTIGVARMKLAAASSADEETQATKELKVALDAYFDRDLEERNRLLKTVRADIEKMKQKLEKRANSKNSIIDLQFKMVVNEASGLGFFSPAATSNDLSDPNLLSR